MMSDSTTHDLSSTTLPVLPLSTGVVLPQMVVTIALETPEAQRGGGCRRRQAPAVGAPDRRSVRRRRHRGRHRGRRRAPRRDAGPGGPGSAPGRDRRRRARHGRGAVGADRRRGPDQRRHRPGPRALPRVQGRGREHPGGPGRARPGRRPAGHGRARRGGRHGGLLARPVRRAEGRGPGDARRRGPSGPGARVGQGDAGRAGAEGAHPQGRDRRHGEDTAGVPAAPADGRHPEGAGRGVRRRRGARRASGR